MKRADNTLRTGSKSDCRKKCLHDKLGPPETDVVEERPRRLSRKLALRFWPRARAKV